MELVWEAVWQVTLPTIYLQMKHLVVFIDEKRNYMNEVWMRSRSLAFFSFLRIVRYGRMNQLGDQFWNSR